MIWVVVVWGLVAVAYSWLFHSNLSHQPWWDKHPRYVTAVSVVVGLLWPLAVVLGVVLVIRNIRKLRRK